LGCGHTGTTLISGILHINGYGSFRVSRLFENLSLNDLNRRILNGDDVAEDEIRGFLRAVEMRSRGRWSLKDPRLSETISELYSRIAEPVKIIFNYRHPGPTVRSLIRERELHESYLTPQQMLESAQEEWLTRNRAALNFLDTHNHSPLLITNYDDLVDRRMDAIVCRFVGKPLDMSFIQPVKRRSSPVAVDPELLTVYEDLNRRFAANTNEIMLTTVPISPKTNRNTPSVRTRAHVFSNRVQNGLRRRAGVVRDLIAGRRNQASLL
jgi:hypothetical protein